MVMDGGGESPGLLGAVHGLMSSVFLPSLTTLHDGWGALETSPEKESTKEGFLAQVEGFVDTLDGMIC